MIISNAFFRFWTRVVLFPQHLAEFSVYLSDSFICISLILSYVFLWFCNLYFSDSGEIMDASMTRVVLSPQQGRDTAWVRAVWLIILLFFPHPNANIILKSPSILCGEKSQICQCQPWYKLEYRCNPMQTSSWSPIAMQCLNMGRKLSKVWICHPWYKQACSSHQYLSKRLQILRRQCCLPTTHQP